MSIVTITLNGKNFQLSCVEGTEPELLKLADSVDRQLKEIRNSNITASAELISVILNLSFQQKIFDMERKIQYLVADKPEYEEEKFAETLSTIAGYLDNLAKKLSK